MKPQKMWIGRWLGIVAVLHTLFALVVFGKIYLSIVQRGWFDSLGQDPMLNAAIWFLLFGAPLALLAMLIHAMEKSGKILLARPMAWGLGVMTVFGVSLMPASGFWLVIPAVLGLWRQTERV